jgi:hypothetical protein
MADPRSITVADIILEPVVVKVGSTNIGVTEGGVRLRIEQEVVEQKVDQYDGPINTWRTGLMVSVTFRMLQPSYTNMALVLWGSTARSSGGTALGMGGKVPGANDAQTDGVTINLHPAKTDDATLTRDVNIWKCVPIEVGEISYGKDGTPSIEVTFKGHLDTSKTAAGKGLLDFGLTAAT